MGPAASLPFRGPCVRPRQPRRAILKATDVCATEPSRAARQLVEGGLAQNYDYALQVLTDLRYNAWRELDPEESLRFYARWLHEFGQLNSTPNAIIAEGTDWRFPERTQARIEGVRKGPLGGSVCPAASKFQGSSGADHSVARALLALAEPCPARGRRGMERAKIIERTTRGRLHRLRIGEMSTVAVNLV